MALIIENSEAAKALPNAVEAKEKEDLFFVVARVLGEGACLRMVCKLRVHVCLCGMLYLSGMLWLRRGCIEACLYSKLASYRLACTTNLPSPYNADLIVYHEHRIQMHSTL
jgi:hypothetical protein